MPLGRPNDLQAASRPSKGWTIAVVAALLASAAFVFATPSASAIQLEVPGVAKLEVPGVTVPQLPPPVPLPVPAPPPAVKVPDLPAPLPSPSSPPVPKPSGSPGDVARSGGDSTPGVRSDSGDGHSTGEVRSAGVEAPRPQAVPGRESGVSSDRSGGGGRADGGESAIRPGVAVPRRHLVAYVWPAIALGQVGEALVMQLARLGGVTFPTPGMAPSLSLLTGNAAASGVPEPPRRSATPDASRPAPASPLAPHGGGMGLLAAMITVLAALVGVVALARLTVGEDLFSSRWLH